MIVRLHRSVNPTQPNTPLRALAVTLVFALGVGIPILCATAIIDCDVDREVRAPRTASRTAGGNDTYNVGLADPDPTTSESSLSTASSKTQTIAEYVATLHNYLWIDPSTRILSVDSPTDIEYDAIMATSDVRDGFSFWLINLGRGSVSFKMQHPISEWCQRASSHCYDLFMEGSAAVLVVREHGQWVFYSASSGMTTHWP